MVDAKHPTSNGQVNGGSPVQPPKWQPRRIEYGGSAASPTLLATAQQLKTINSVRGYMRTRTLSGWVLGVVLASGTSALGVAQDAPKPPQTTVSSNIAVAAVPASAVPAPANNVRDKTSSSTFHASPWVDEVERLTKAGVDEGVVLAYVINSAGTFNLTADQIVRLKNIGVSPRIVNAMIQHDPELISGARPLTAAPPPSLPASFQAALAAHPQSAVATATPSTASPPPVPAPVQIIANDDYDADRDWIYVEPDDVPDQPAILGPVRAPYPVKLNDPIIVLRLPSLSVPYW